MIVISNASGRLERRSIGSEFVGKLAMATAFPQKGFEGGEARTARGFKESVFGFGYFSLREQQMSKVVKELA